MDWREAEEAVEIKCEDLQSKLNLCTQHDIHGHYDEVMIEFKKKLGESREACFETLKSIRLLLRDYGDSIPSRSKEYWLKMYYLYPESIKSQLRAAVTRVKENVLASASNSSASGDSKASEVLGAQRQQTMS